MQAKVRFQDTEQTAGHIKLRPPSSRTGTLHEAPANSQGWQQPSTASLLSEVWPTRIISVLSRVMDVDRLEGYQRCPDRALEFIEPPMKGSAHLSEA